MTDIRRILFLPVLSLVLLWQDVVLAMGGGAPPPDPNLPFYGRSYAVVVGIGRYPSASWSDLGYARKDAEGMASMLRRQGFEVVTFYDNEATREAIVSVFEDYIAPRLNKNDRVLVFFSGHGHTQTLGGSDYGYLVPYNGGETYGSLISMETLRGLSGKMAGAKHQLFIIDACFGGLFAPTKSRTDGISRTHPRYVQEVTRRDARQFITAGGKGQQVLDNGPNGYSYFTGYLLEALNKGLGDLDGDGYITTSELVTYLVPKATNDYQSPGTGTLPGHGLGEFLFLAPSAPRVSSATPARRPPPQQAARSPPQRTSPPEQRQRTATLGLKGGEQGGSVQQEVLFWQSMNSSTRAEDYQAYLQAFPDGVFASLARNRIRQYGSGEAPAADPSPAAVSEPAVPPQQTAKAVPGDIDAYIERNPHDSRRELAHFLDSNFTVIGGSLEVMQIWKHEPLEPSAGSNRPGARWTRINFDVRMARDEVANRTGEFLLEVRGDRLIVHEARKLNL